ncbi:MAG: hypothetical protein BM557_11510 [Flavobacterium sp. MedPE-SWcel]|uniref:hypothetical protein n=1 Tax=uncultured Flavobacterium sp. TaxID=165435 RepID=UPI000924711D|nr:hypothetical protein [uncultured Flavobacterium sp.]OIQ15388.1 MAG: hypothetical protein BM557_11510 [Flavobacterium sp. MedPE-SWcel]
MKKILALVALVLVFGCDDGDITVKSFDFSGASVSTCTQNNIYYKTNTTEALILEIAPSNLYNIESELDGTGSMIPREIAITTSGANKVLYRNYNGPASTTNLICNTGDLTVTSPSVIEEWTGEGTILVTTQKDYTNGKLTGYIHNITLKQITFNSGNETIRINDNLFGSFTSPLGFNFSYGDEETPIAVACETASEDRVYKTSGNDVIILNFPDNTFVNVVGTLPIIELSADEEDYELLFKTYSGTVNSSIVCDLDTTIDINQNWRASSGSIIVVTTEDDINPGTFFHEIRLKDVVFSRTDVTSGETFTLYEVLSEENAQEAEDNGGFLLGTYVTN